MCKLQFALNRIKQRWLDIKTSIFSEKITVSEKHVTVMKLSTTIAHYYSVNLRSQTTNRLNRFDFPTINNFEKWATG